jgi:hypothetical protein
LFDFKEVIFAGIIDNINKNKREFQFTGYNRHPTAANIGSVFGKYCTIKFQFSGNGNCENDKGDQLLLNKYDLDDDRNYEVIDIEIDKHHQDLDLITIR